jgi:hypothetical protein
VICDGGGNRRWPLPVLRRLLKIPGTHTASGSDRGKIVGPCSATRWRLQTVPAPQLGRRSKGSRRARLQSVAPTACVGCSESHDTLGIVLGGARPAASLRTRCAKTVAATLSRAARRRRDATSSCPSAASNRIFAWLTWRFGKVRLRLEPTSSTRRASLPRTALKLPTRTQGVLQSIEG